MAGQPSWTDRFVVSELSKSWVKGKEKDKTPLLCTQFEDLLNFQHAQGYRLVRFQLAPFMDLLGNFTETIIAVFERMDPLRPKPTDKHESN